MMQRAHQAAEMVCGISGEPAHNAGQGVPAVQGGSFVVYPEAVSAHVSGDKDVSRCPAPTQLIVGYYALVRLIQQKG
jgi:hypothetical protein